MLEKYNGPGIYTLTNEKTKMIYVGKSLSGCQKRIETHYSELKYNRHPIKRLQWDYNNGDAIKDRVIYKFNMPEVVSDKTTMDYILSDVEWLCFRLLQENHGMYNLMIPAQRMRTLPGLLAK